jgi:hypothetical protein
MKEQCLECDQIFIFTGVFAKFLISVLNVVRLLFVTLYYSLYYRMLKKYNVKMYSESELLAARKHRDW